MWSIPKSDFESSRRDERNFLGSIFFAKNLALILQTGIIHSMMDEMKERLGFTGS